jgi:hypothetical protein
VAEHHIDFSAEGSTISCGQPLLFSLQRKLRLVKNSASNRVLAKGLAMDIIFVKVSLPLEINIFPFTVSIAQLIGKFWKHR